jgi:hypothetical protein
MCTRSFVHGITMSVAAVLLAGAVLATSCSSGEEQTASSTADPSTTVASGDAQAGTAATVPADLCEVWSSISDGAVGTDNEQPTSKDGWDSKVAWTEQLVAAAPAGQQANAQAYLGVVERRADLFAEYGYVSVAGLPADVRETFIAENSADQQKANEFIASTKDVCS